MKKKAVYPVIEAELARRFETRRSLAKAIGITPGLMSKKMRGICDWKLSEVQKVCKHFNMKFEKLFIKEEE